MTLPWKSANVPAVDTAVAGGTTDRPSLIQHAHTNGAEAPRTNFKEDDVAKRIELNVDGQVHAIEAEPDMPLLYALRDDLGLKNPRFGCGLSQCGACTVLLDGQPVRSCSMPVGSVGTGKITTLNGIGTPEKPHKIQAAFIEEQVPQCGYCLNGWIMTSVALLEKNPKPSDAQIREALSGIKCRCGTHVGVLRAVKRAAQA
jgi:nicotinate dehydrogenase subunit A